MHCPKKEKKGGGRWVREKATPISARGELPDIDGKKKKERKKKGCFNRGTGEIISWKMVLPEEPCPNPTANRSHTSG